MVEFITAVRVVDKITDIIPVLGNAKNIGIYIYQLCHKIDETANPVTTATATWTDDLKINALSKNFWGCYCIYLLPIIGEILFLCSYVYELFSYCFGCEQTDCYGNPEPDFLTRIIRERGPHCYEAITLELARRPKMILDLDVNPDLMRKFVHENSTYLLLSEAPNFEIMEKVLWNTEDLKRNEETTANSIFRLIRHFNEYSKGEFIVRLIERLMNDDSKLMETLVKDFGRREEILRLLSIFDEQKNILNRFKENWCATTRISEEIGISLEEAEASDQIQVGSLLLRIKSSPQNITS